MLTQTLLTGLLTAGAGNSTAQRIAAATIVGAKDTNAATVADAILSCDQVDPDVLAQLLAHPHPQIRANAWARPEVTSDQAAEAARTEAAPGVLTALVAKLTAADLVEIVRFRNSGRRRCQALYEAALDTRVQDLPADLIGEALERLGSTGVSRIAKVAASGLDLTAVVTSDIPACFRFAACVSSGTPTAVVDEHIEEILSDKTLTAVRRWPAFTQLLVQLAERVPDAFLLWEAYRAARSVKPAGDAPSPVVERAEVARLARLRLALANAQDPQSVAHVWAQAAGLGEQMSQLVLRHLYCPYDVAVAVLATTSLSASEAAGPRPLWTRQDRDLFTTLVRQVPDLLPERLEAAAQSSVDEPLATLVDWSVDALLGFDNRPGGATRTWLYLLAHPLFPRHRLGELPGSLVNEVLWDRRDELAWVGQTVNGWMSSLADVDPDVAATVLGSALTHEGQLGAAFTAVNHAIR